MSVGFVADELTSIFIKFCIAINFQWRPERARGSHPLNVCVVVVKETGSFISPLALEFVARGLKTSVYIRARPGFSISYKSPSLLQALNPLPRCHPNYQSLRTNKF